MAFHVFAIDSAQTLYPNGVSFACRGKPMRGARLHLHTLKSVVPVAQGSEVHHERKPDSLSMRATHLQVMMQCDLGPLQAGICSSSLASTDAVLSNAIIVYIVGRHGSSHISLSRFKVHAQTDQGKQGVESS